MPLTDAGRDAMLDSSSDWPPAFLSLHSADPGIAGTAELDPPYSRQASTWTVADGELANDSPIVFTIPAGSTTAYFGLWSEAATFLGSGPLDPVSSGFTATVERTVPIGGIRIR